MAALATMAACSPQATISSPDGKLSLSLDTRERTYAVKYQDSTLLCASVAQMDLLLDSAEVGAWPEGVRVRKHRSSGTVTEHISAPFYRQSSFDYSYKSLVLDLGRGFSMEWRVSDDGVAYRFLNSNEGTSTVLSETADFRFSDDGSFTYGPTQAENPYFTSYEVQYQTSALSETPGDIPSVIPASLKLPCGLRVTIAESDVHSYPRAFLRHTGDGTTLSAEFAPYPGEDFIARSTGSRSYPWRIIKVTGRDSQIAEDNLIYALASPNRIGEDLSWIKPGFCAWEWWNDWGLEGVPFQPGINNETYRYFIDFASDNGLEYVVLDEGWGKRGPGQNLLVPIPGLDLQGLADYASKRNVRLILWAVMDRLGKDTEKVCSTYEKMGIAGFKPDFLSRTDQVAVEMAESIAEVCARHHLMLDYHGLFAPAGLNRTWPNIINQEGVLGLETCKFHASLSGNFLSNDVTVAFLRQMAGFCDYTPGAMHNMTPDEFTDSYSHPASIGTRARQVALYGVLDSPLTMLCDSPTSYMKEPETTSFIASLPRIYDSKTVLDGEIGKYIVVCRRKGDTAYISGITDDTPRDVTLPIGELSPGYSSLTVFRDAPDCTENASSYILETISQAADSLTIHMAPGGGFMVRIR